MCTSLSPPFSLYFSQYTYTKEKWVGGFMTYVSIGALIARGLCLLKVAVSSWEYTLIVVSSDTFATQQNAAMTWYNDSLHGVTNCVCQNLSGSWRHLGQCTQIWKETWFPWVSTFLSAPPTQYIRGKIKLRVRPDRWMPCHCAVCRRVCNTVVCMS